MGNLWDQAHAKRAEAGEAAARAAELRVEADELEDRARSEEGSQSEGQATADREAEDANHPNGRQDRQAEHISEAIRHMAPDDAEAARAKLEQLRGEGATLPVAVGGGEGEESE